MIYKGWISKREKAAQGEGERAHKQLLHPQVNDTGMKRAETGRVAAMGGHPPPSLAAAPAPAPPPAEAAPAAPLVFSPHKLAGVCLARGRRTLLGAGRGRADPRRGGR